MTDVLSMTWYLAAIVAAWYGRDRFVWAVAAGAAVGVAVLVRPANLLIVLPLSVVFGVRWRSWIGLVLGGIPAAAFQAWYNLALFGRLLATGYGDLSENFGARFVPWNIRYLSGELFATLGPVVLGAAVLALWLSRRRGTMMRLLIAWFVTVVGFHLFCEYSGFWGCVRYLLPAFPPIIVAALLGSREVVEKIRDAGWRRVVAVGLCVVSLGWELVMCQRRDVTIMKRGEIIYVQIADWMRRNAPANAWVVSRQASGALYYYTRFQIVRPDIMTRPNRDVFYAAAEKTKHPVYAVMFDPERKEAMGRMGGEWQELARYGAMTAWRLVRAPESRE